MGGAPSKKANNIEQTQQKPAPAKKTEQKPNKKLQQSQQLQQPQPVVVVKIDKQLQTSLLHDDGETKPENIQKLVAVNTVFEHEQAKQEELVKIYNDYCKPDYEPVQKPMTDRLHARHSSEGSLLFNRSSLDNIMERQIGKKLRQPDLAEGPKPLDANARVGLFEIKDPLVDKIHKELKEDQLKRLGSLVGVTDYYKAAIRDKVYIQSADVYRKAAYLPEYT